MKKVFLMVVAIALIGWGQVFAASFTFTFDGGPINAGGSLDAAVAYADGRFLATAGSGTGGLAGFALYANPNAPLTTVFVGFEYDNLLYPANSASEKLDLYGLLFYNGSDYINIWGNGPDTQYTYYEYATSTNSYTALNQPGDFTLTQVPEPTTMLLLGLGLVGVGIIRRKNR